MPAGTPDGHPWGPAVNSWKSEHDALWKLELMQPSRAPDWLSGSVHTGRESSSLHQVSPLRIHCSSGMSATLSKRWPPPPTLPIWPGPFRSPWTMSIAISGLPASRNLPALGPNTPFSYLAATVIVKYGNLIMSLSCQNLSTGFPLHLEIVVYG